ncbi:MAG: alpha/beta fold hydrolase [Chloroflexota bacterium]|nr:alpha/beta fold hydrolase [Ardenticatenaceae bacterium]
MMTNNNFYIEPFSPMVGVKNGYAQSIAASFLRPTHGLTFQRERLDTPDGDFLDIDLPSVPGITIDAAAPCVLALHGLEGSAQRGYMQELYRQLAERGIRAVGLNFRSCSGEMNRTTRFYHAGATDDVAFALRWLAQRYPDAPLGLVGFSLGANATLKYVGENGRFLSAAVAISPPFDLMAGSQILRRLAGRLLGQHFLDSLFAKVEAKATTLAGHVDVADVLAARDLWQFDERLTAPLHGFHSAMDYYLQNSSGRFLADVRVPTLLLRALDDPLFSVADIPFATIHANPYLHLALTEHGGHVGFWEHTTHKNGHSPWWAERQAARFLAQQLHA